MLPRRRTYNHVSAGPFQLPILVPSFSSKGFGMERREEALGDVPDDRWCLAAHHLEMFGRYPARSVLVSAYDIHFRYWDAPGIAPTLEHLRKTALVFLDSGGYELTGDYDSAEYRRSPYIPRKDYELSEYRSVLRTIAAKDPTIPLLITNFDHDTSGEPLELQIDAAQRLFSEYREWASSFVIKPTMKTKDDKPKGPVDIKALRRADYKTMAQFDVIGVTDKELGRNLWDKLKNLCRLRRGLDEVDCSAPIHLWGGLDPVLTPLFFFAGADIFDGISWLRYAYHYGVALNRESGVLLDPDIRMTTNPREVEFMTAYHNLRVLDDLTVALRRWVDAEGNEFGMFDGRLRHHLQAGYQRLLEWQLSSKGGR